MPHEYLPGTMAERLQDLLKEKKMTQEQLADALGLSESTINRYINGQTEKISTETIIAMAKLFNVSTDFLLGLTNIPYKTNFDMERLGMTEKSGHAAAERRDQHGCAQLSARAVGFCHTDHADRSDAQRRIRGGFRQHQPDDPGNDEGDAGIQGTASGR